MPNRLWDSRCEYFSTAAESRQLSNRAGAASRLHILAARLFSTAIDGHQSTHYDESFALPPDTMSTTDEELSQLEKEIRVLKIEYEQFFAGGRKRPPSDTQWRVELIIKRYGDRGPDMSFGQRFRYSNLTQTYAKYSDIWRKKLQQKEEGNAPRHFGAAAKAIAADRAERAARVRGNAGQVYITALADPDLEISKVEELYKKLLEARKSSGETTPTPPLDEFQQFVRRKTLELREKKHCQQVEYVVALESGHVKLKARVRNP